MDDDSDVRDHLNAFRKINKELLNAEAKINEEDLAIILLSSLPSAYETLRTTLLVREDTLTVDEQAVEIRLVTKKQFFMKTEKWMAAISEEMELLHKYYVGVVKLPKKVKTIGCKWVFRKKEVVFEKEVQNFEMKDLGAAKKIFLMEISRDIQSKKQCITQKKYIQIVLQRSSMLDAKLVNTPLVAHFKLSHNLALVFSMRWSLCQKCRMTMQLDVLYYAGNLDSRSSMTSYVSILCGRLFCWRSVLQSALALSATEANYVAVTEASKEALWLKGLVKEQVFNQVGILLHCDSENGIHLTKNHIHHARIKQLMCDIIRSGSGLLLEK
ncbi:hypothetical protein RJ639_003146 [Escallonia herrerae]|uniref:Retrovirus-related Pol polyprotein from transposon TNT 1-94 n=1 Tax=Escallonia herrerae TaxID=1293975 RepID=A0AA89AWR3_9ASTE|nr:hypothetical protein RJ639_003146 [Escallonia herrerae]